MKSYREILLAIDVSKNSHKAMFCDPTGKIVMPPFDFDIYKEGFNVLMEKIKQTKAKEVSVGLEPTSHYHEKLSQFLKDKGYRVNLINPFTTFKVRSLRMDKVKTDKVDLAAISEALILKKSSPFPSPEYGKLRALTRFRRSVIHARSSLKNQAHCYLDKLWPGFSNRLENQKALYSNLWRSKIALALISICPDPRKIVRLSEEQLILLLKSKAPKGLGKIGARRIIEQAKTIQIKPFTEREIICFNLKKTLEQINGLSRLMAGIEVKIEKLFPKEAHLLLSIKGITKLTAAEFIAELGDLDRFPSPSQVIKYAGLNVSVNQSGLFKSKNAHITKSGNKYLRAAVMTIAFNLMRHNFCFKHFADRFRLKGKKFHVVWGAVATKFIRASFYMLKRKEKFNPDIFMNTKKSVQQG